MRLLVIAPQPFFTQRGTPIAVRMALETLAERGYEMDVIVFPGGEDVEIPNCRLIRVPALPGLRNIGPGFSLKKVAADIVMTPMIAYRLGRTRYDAVVAVEEAGFIMWALRPIFGTPYVLDVDSLISEQIQDKFERLPRWIHRMLVGLERASARRAIGAVTCCRALEESVRALAPETPVRTVEDIAMLEPDDGRGPPEDCRFDAPVIMYVGNLESYQGVDLLLDGFARLDLAQTPAQLVIIGGSEAHVAAGRARAEALGVAHAVSYLGPRPVSDLGRYLRAAAIVASPRTQGRNTPMKVYSYLDSGRPLIATRLSTHTQVLDDAISMLVEPTPEDMARGLQELLADPALGARLSAAAAVRVRAEFCREAYARKLNGFFSEVVEARLGRGTSAEAV